MRKLIAIILLSIFTGGCATNLRVIHLDKGVALAVEIARYTPDRTHYSTKTPPFKWVLLKTTHDETEFPDLAEKVRFELGKKFTVYSELSDIPDEYVGNFQGSIYYKSGFLYSYHVQRIDDHCILLRWDDYESPMSAGRQELTYCWNGRRWRITKRGDLIVS